jgi:hypothetical protein
LLPPDEFLAACTFVLKTPRGDRLGFVEPAYDPLKCPREEAPKEIQEALKRAEAGVEEARRIREQAFERYMALLNGLNKRKRAFRGSGDRDVVPKRLQELEAQVPEAHRDWQEALDLAQTSRIELAKAENLLARWRYDERQRRRAEKDREEGRVKPAQTGRRAS